MCVLYLCIVIISSHMHHHLPSLSASLSASLFAFSLSPSLHSSVPLFSSLLPRYNMVVEARDGGTPPRIGTANVIIRIININDNSPRFDRSFFATQISEGQSAHT